MIVLVYGTWLIVELPSHGNFDGLLCHCYYVVGYIGRRPVGEWWKLSTESNEPSAVNSQNHRQNREEATTYTDMIQHRLQYSRLPVATVLSIDSVYSY